MALPAQLFVEGPSAPHVGHAQDLKKGDAVQLETWGWVKVARVNAKSMSFHADGRSWTNKADYSKVQEVHSEGTQTS